MLRVNLSYDDVIEKGLNLLKEETEFVYEGSKKQKAESAIRMSGIIDFILALDKATKITKDVESVAKDYQE